MRLTTVEHRSRPWRVHQLAAGFRLEDAWALPVTGGRHDFDALVDQLARFDPLRMSSRAARTLFAVRHKLGRLLRWDDPSGSTAGELFSTVYRTDDEWAARLANKLVDGIVHLGWVPQADGVYRAEMAIYVQPHGVRGAAYMAAIRPFRHLVVYPALLREIGRAWEAAHARTGS